MFLKTLKLPEIGNIGFNFGQKMKLYLLSEIEESTPDFGHQGL
jgi:hypothetical protein